MCRKRTITSWEGLNILGFDDISSNSFLESSPYEESNDSSNDFSANEPSVTTKKMAQYVAFRVHIAPEQVFKQSCDPSKKIHPKNSESA